uniref:TPT domain-containing protein n=1 Tax=Macrostomum lignano TaxID=282301 RepID=A0A1I8H0M7_9PLAT
MRRTVGQPLAPVSSFNLHSTQLSYIVSGKDMRQQHSISFMTQSTRIFAVVAAYWVVSISLVFLNKYLLSSDELKLDAPYFVTWFQCLVSLVLCYLLAGLAHLVPMCFSFPSVARNPTLKIFRLNSHPIHHKIRLQVCRKVAPLSFIFVAMVTFNNLCLKDVGISFYYAGRSFTTVFNALLSYVILGQTTSLKAIICCGFIIVGFLLGMDQEKVSGSLSVSGVVYGLLASLFVALNAIYTKKVLPAVDNNVWKLTLYNNLNAVLIFLPLLVLTGDAGAVAGSQLISSAAFWLVMLASGVLGFAIGYVTGLQIQFTSPLTHNVSGTAKSCAQTVLGYLAYREVKTGLWWLSNVIVLTASFAYALVKRQEMRLQHQLEMAWMSAGINRIYCSDARCIADCENFTLDYFYY